MNLFTNNELIVLFFNNIWRIPVYNNDTDKREGKNCKENPNVTKHDFANTCILTN